ncbi:MAG: chemotaxis protein CheW [Nisaea sp.]|uniref:hybrid sensor histidine kinase/response regulator n=1 Tax=Nisaea sp. TaxID=2024842 RepID=UPI001B287174|nr:chemotaxis protein CheW [Nisaea sp.]MBO6560021.1 chemotaxis protein CheW [Nisaea sp.]
MDELLSEFLTETSESVSELDVELVQLEQNPNDQALLSNIFRLVHTIKGTCGFLGLPRLEAVAHAAENVLGRIRDGSLEVTPDAITLILESFDRIKWLLSSLEENEVEPEGDDQDLIDRLNIVAEGGALGEDAGAAAPAEEPVAEEPAPELDRELKPGEVSLDELERAFMEAPGPEDMAAEEPEAEAAEEPAEPEPAAEAPPPAAKKEVAVSGGQSVAKQPEQDKQVRESAVANQTIRVNVDLLENLMTMVSELVLTRNQLMQISRNEKDSEFTVPLQRLSQVTSELQEGVMKTRMQPIGNAWSKLPRLVRDLSIELNKKIDLVMLGADTELDRQVLELIKDPLTHMVRNSADHGIEEGADRVAAGKPEGGTITLNAYHEGGHIIIEIKDDGKGLDPEKIKAKAIANGLVAESEADSLSEQQIQQFIFRAGFSTAAQVTSVSGRGVGMDVVRTNIEKIGGTIELKSVFGRGSTFIIKIPLTLAIVSALIVEAGGERFAIPQLSVVELVRASSNSEHKIEEVHGTPVLRLRNRLLPLVSLRRLLRLDEGVEEMPQETFIVVLQIGTYSVGIMVDRVFDTEEIVVKPVAPILRNITLFSGNTILGDGSVIMILDPNGIAAASGELKMVDEDAKDTARQLAHRSDVSSLLLFRAGGKSPKAVPLALVARLEEIDLASVEYSEGRPLVQYRGQLMPLIPMVEDMKLEMEGRQPVLVFTDNDRSMGLIVDEIVDIVEDRIHIEVRPDHPWLMGSAVIAGKATEVIDAGYYLTQAYGDWFGSADSDSQEPEASRRVLLVDDSAFFRNLIKPLLSVAGYEVTIAEHAEAALDLCENGADFDAIISDIEMPGMDGFELTRRLRSIDRWQETPIIALSSHTSPRDLDRGREVGFTDYIAKLDRDALLETLAQTIDA